MIRLINCDTLELEARGFASQDDVPPYVILSHTWAQDGGEVTYQEYLAGRDQSPDKGWDKVEQAMETTRQQGMTYLWIDSCCIDKSKDSELSESINSMFKWYTEAAVCFAYIEDFSCNRALDGPDRGSVAGTARSDFNDSMTAQLSTCRWFYRGWTLQELIAPVEIRFYDQSWQFFGTRDQLKSTISSITKMDGEILAAPAEPGVCRDVRALLEEVSVAKKMSWAASRQTSRLEDMAYSLLGIFNVSMPLIYGEGARAFMRLQEEIMQQKRDTTIFAWREEVPPPTGRSNDTASSHVTTATTATSRLRGILARSPAEFRDASDLVMSTGSAAAATASTPLVYTKTNGYLRVKTALFPGYYHNPMLSLNCHRKGDPPHRTLGILLSRAGPDSKTYCRLEPSRLVYKYADVPTMAERELDLEMDPSPTRMAEVTQRRATQTVVRFRFDPSHLRATRVVPSNHSLDQGEVIATCEAAHSTNVFSRIHLDVIDAAAKGRWGSVVVAVVVDSDATRCRAGILSPSQHDDLLQRYEDDDEDDFREKMSNELSASTTRRKVVAPLAEESNNGEYVTWFRSVLEVSVQAHGHTTMGTERLVQVNVHSLPSHKARVGVIIFVLALMAGGIIAGVYFINNPITI